MREVTILHLSDLHLSFNDEVEVDSFISQLCDCIKEYRAERKKDISIIAITGDLIDKGHSEWLEKFYELFIERIRSTASQDRNPDSVSVICVPGNHDAERDDYINQLREEYKSNRTGACFEINRTTLKKALARFEDFELLNEKLINKKGTFGVEKIKIDNLAVSIIRVNSAIYTHDENDYRQLGLSKFQLQELSKQYKRINENEGSDLTIALMHHPDDWLRPDEQNAMWDYFASNKLPVDIILHGHIHESRVGGKIDLDSFVLSLVTGTTYEIGKKDEDHKKAYLNCRVAFYTIDIDNKTIQGTLYVTNAKGKFVEDRLNYNAVDKNGMFTIPYKKEAMLKKGSIVIPIPKDNNKEINSEYATYLNEMIERMWVFEKTCRCHIGAFVTDEELLHDNDVIKDFFLHVANCAKNCLFSEEERESVRVHFRKYRNKKHVHFCATMGEREITPIRWGPEKNLIFHAYDTKRSLVKSLNPDLYFDTQGDWKDFMTVPVFEKEENQIPQFSFGISIKGNNIDVLTQRLELLSFLRFESVLESVISSFFRYRSLALQSINKE